MLPRLRLFAEHYARCIAYCCDGAWQADDLVDESLKRILSGKRKWDRLTCPSLYEFLKGVIRSTATVQKKKTKTHFTTHPNNSIGCDSAISNNSNSSHLNNPEQRILNMDHLQKVRSKIETQFSDDDEVQLLIMSYEDGLFAPREIAEATGISIGNVNNAKRRLHRATQTLLTADTDTRRKKKEVRHAKD